MAADVRTALSAALWTAGDTHEAQDRVMIERARKLQNYFAQPFFAAEPFSNRPGTHVPFSESLSTYREILEGRHDAIPAEVFYFAGGIEEIRNRAHRQ
ncbi:MAG: hypothetical protein ACREUT_07790 [Steroidobacteraceae bacterium]